MPHKLISLFTIMLFNNRYFSLSELASSDRINASKPSVSRLIRQLETSSLGNIQRLKRGKEVFFKLERPAHLPAISFNAEGLRQLSLCRELLLNFLPKGMHRNMQTTLSQAACYLPENGGALPSGIGGTLYKGHINYEAFQEIIETLTRAIIENRVCSVLYKSTASGEAKEHDFAPKRFLAYRESLYAQGFFVTEMGAVRLKYDDDVKLAVHRIKSCDLTRRSSKDIGDVPQVNGAFGFIEESEPFMVKIRFTAEAAMYVAEREWSDGQEIKRHKDGSLTLCARMNNPGECISWILGFGDKARIIAPKWLREQFCDTLKKMNKIYGLAKNERENAEAQGGGVRTTAINAFISGEQSI